MSSKGLRLRIIILQIGLILVLGFVSGFALWAGGYTQNSVTTQLKAQEITFPAYNSASIVALPKSDAVAMNQYAGELMTTGNQAEVWADDYMKVHLQEIGETYSQASTKARANPGNATDASTLTTVFEGTMLRSSLLNAYGWWTVGSYAFYAGIGFAVAAFIVLLALCFEITQWRRPNVVQTN